MSDAPPPPPPFAPPWGTGEEPHSSVTLAHAHAHAHATTARTLHVPPALVDEAIFFYYDYFKGRSYTITISLMRDPCTITITSPINLTLKIIGNRVKNTITKEIVLKSLEAGLPSQSLAPAVFTPTIRGREGICRGKSSILLLRWVTPSKI